MRYRATICLLHSAIAALTMMTSLAGGDPMSFQDCMDSGPVVMTQYFCLPSDYRKDVPPPSKFSIKFPALHSFILSFIHHSPDSCAVSGYFCTCRRKKLFRLEERTFVGNTARFFGWGAHTADFAAACVIEVPCLSRLYAVAFREGGSHGKIEYGFFPGPILIE